MSAPPAPSPRSTVSTLALAAAMVAITLGGLGIVFTTALSLIAPAPPGFSPPVQDASVVAGMMVAFGSATVAFIAFMLIKVFARIMGLPPAPDSGARLKKPFGYHYRFGQLPSPPEGISSVTEHTTRNFRPPVHDEVRARE
ncbi:MAG TPA: hypothetical protein VJZ26_04205 [Blastocatellia bacterium]|nr:hypothetical protein [Blastocatellia bacterium]